MLTESRITDIIVTVLEAANRSRLPEESLDTSRTAVLFGPGSALDSLGLVAVLIDIEEALQTEGESVSLSDERAMSQRHSPFRTVPSLATYIGRLVSEDA